MAFDKTKSYGEIYGDADGRRYFQDGVYYDAQGKEIGGAKAARPAKAPAKAAEVPAPTPEDTASQVDSQLGDALA